MPNLTPKQQELFERVWNPLEPVLLLDKALTYRQRSFIRANYGTRYCLSVEDRLCAVFQVLDEYPNFNWLYNLQEDLLSQGWRTYIYGALRTQWKSGIGAAGVIEDFVPMGHSLRNLNKIDSVELLNKMEESKAIIRTLDDRLFIS